MKGKRLPVTGNVVKWLRGCSGSALLMFVSVFFPVAFPTISVLLPHRLRLISDLFSCSSGRGSWPPMMLLANATRMRKLSIYTLFHTHPALYRPSYQNCSSLIIEFSTLPKESACIYEIRVSTSDNYPRSRYGQDVNLRGVGLSQPK